MRQLDQNNAVVLFSGGQDSSIALAWALERFNRVETVGFDYGQRHGIELKARGAVRRAIQEAFPEWAKKLKDDTMINAGGMRALGETAMTHDLDIASTETGLPTTFVPGRNLFFFVLAGALAYRRNTGTLIGGMCETDFSGYPDCREAALSAQAEALRLGMDATFAIETPLMHITKADSWRLAEQLGGETLVEIINEHSHSCYRGVRDQRHEWGYGCGECPACVLRAKGWAAYRSGI